MIFCKSTDREGNYMKFLTLEFDIASINIVVQMKIRHPVHETQVRH